MIATCTNTTRRQQLFQRHDSDMYKHHQKATALPADAALSPRGRQQRQTARGNGSGTGGGGAPAVRQAVEQIAGAVIRARHRDLCML